MLLYYLNLLLFSLDIYIQLAFLKYPTPKENMLLIFLEPLSCALVEEYSAFSSIHPSDAVFGILMRPASE